jgi:hypothetical protein
LRAIGVGENAYRARGHHLGGEIGTVMPCPWQRGIQVSGTHPT